MGELFLKVAVLAFVASLGLGLFMGIAHDHGLLTVHAHLALMGWASMALFAIAYRIWPRLEGGWLARGHFWLYTAGLVLTVVGLVLLETGNTATGDPLTGLGSVINVLGALCFVAKVLRTDLAAAGG